MSDDITSVFSLYQKQAINLTLLTTQKSGKEATVYQVTDGSKLYALKVYKAIDQRAFHKNETYYAGKHFRQKSLRRAIARRTTLGKKVIHEYWVRHEYYLLRELNKRGAAIPQIYGFTKESILMDWIGENQPAPRLADVKLAEQKAAEVLEILMQQIEIYLQVGFVHGDLSEYNVLWWRDRPWVIDFPQAIDIRTNPEWQRFLQRDIDTLLNYFNAADKIRAEYYQRFHLQIA